jgi:TonB family protein
MLAPKWSTPTTPGNKVTLPATGSAPRLAGYQRPLSTGFLSNLKEFLTERPVKVVGTGKGAFTQEVYGGGFVENLKEMFRAAPRADGPDPTGLSVNWKSNRSSVLKNLRDLIAPPKLPPLKVTSKPVKVRDIWSKDEAFRPSQAIALAVHLGVLVLIFVPIIHKIQTPVVEAKKIDITELIDPSPYAAKLPPGKDKAGGGGGGGERMNVEPTRGKLPKWSMTQFTPPMATPRNPNPKLPIDPTLLGPPDLKVPSPNLDNFGDPLAKLLTLSGGPGGGGGIGTGTGGGIGSGKGGGLGPGEGGGTGGGIFHPGTGGVGYPSCAYCPDPKYSEEARKAKYQGTVVLQAVITPDGRATEIEVVKGPGLGLEEKAVEAVKTWRFKPAIGPNGKPVAVIVPIEVTFRLL